LQDEGLGEQFAQRTSVFVADVLVLLQKFHQRVDRFHCRDGVAKSVTDADLLPGGKQLFNPASVELPKKRINKNTRAGLIWVECFGFPLETVEARLVLEIKSNPNFAHQGERTGGLPVGFVGQFPPYFVEHVLEIGTAVSLAHYGFTDLTVDAPGTIVVLIHHLKIV